MGEHEQRPMLYPLADALEMSFSIVSGALEGIKKTHLELFEGYSPTICSSVVESLLDFEYGVTGVYLQVWGNLHIAIVNEDAFKQLTLFIIDRSKIHQHIFKPDTKWSRKDVYSAIEPGLQAIYYRCSYEENWERMDNAVVKLKKYNEDRAEQRPARESFNEFWGGVK